MGKRTHLRKSQTPTILCPLHEADYSPNKFAEISNVMNAIAPTDLSAKKQSPMLIEDLKMCESLRRIVNGFTGDPTLQQDMLQECLVCLWKIEAEKPGRTRSWYLQNCRFHVQHWLAAGRSLDSQKRAHAGNRFALHGTEEDAVLDQFHTDGELFETVSVRDLVSTLTPQLRVAERTVLRGLAEGFILREIATQAGISYPTALKYRRRIAALASRLGVCLPTSISDGLKTELVIPTPPTKPLLPLAQAKPPVQRTSQDKPGLTELKHAPAGLEVASTNAKSRGRLPHQVKLINLAKRASRQLAA
jgi:DNA-binding CsgD family transcriptional regulator